MLEVAIAAALSNLVERPLPKLAAVLTDGHSTVIGYNSRKTHPLQLRFNPHNPKAVCLHAEMDSIRQAIRVHGIDLSDFKMYVARVHRDGTVACAKPCAGCQSAILAFNIKTVEWTEDYGRHQ